MSRSIWKGPSFLKQFSLCSRQPELRNQRSVLTSGSASQAQDKTVFIWSRQSTILPKYVGKSIKLHNGKGWALRKVIEGMVGHKFGEFCSTRKKIVHKKNKIKQVSRRKNTA